MNPELIKRIKSYNLDERTKKSTIDQFLNTCISASLYEEVEGEKLEDKINTIYNYLQNIVKEPEVKTVLNIVIADDASSLDYVSYLKQKFDVVVHKVIDVVDPKTIDLVLFTGGEDVNPEYYGERLGKYTSINSKRDLVESDTFYKFKGHCLLLGICRGSQFLTVLSGGRLIQHVEGHGRDHSMVMKGGLKYNITSSHHQMLYPFNLDKKNYDLIAYSEYFQSKTYLNGNNDEIELPKDFLEPEIVYYKNTNALCIQGHPEWSHCEKRTSTMCLNLIDKYLKQFKNLNNSVNYIKSWDDTPYIENENYEENYQPEYEEEQPLF
jgi:GMP synthase-like glutamine amidotransferase